MLLIYLIGCFTIVKAIRNDENKPVLQEILAPRKLVENQNIKLNCDLLRGSKPVQFSWFFNDEPIRESERMQIDTRRDDVSSLIIKEMSVESVGRYKCVGTNEHGSDQQTVTLYVNTKPVIISDLQNITSPLNQLVSLDCQAKGFPRVETKWSRVMQNEIKEHPSNRLEFNLTRETAGQYTCSAWNANGKVERPIRVDYYGSMYLGEKLANSTYTGVLGMIQSKKADLYLRGEPAYLHEDWLAKSVPIQMENVWLGHATLDRKDVSFFNLLDNFKISLTLSLTYLISFLAVFGFAFLIHKLANRIRIRFETRRKVKKFPKQIALIVSSFGVKRLSAIGVFVLFVHLFIWTSQLFLVNNIKTNKVVVDTSQLIKDERDIFGSRRVACMLKNDQLMNIIASSPVKSILWRIFNEKTWLRPDMGDAKAILKGDRCLFDRDPSNFQLTDQINRNAFVIGDRVSANGFLASLIFFKTAEVKLWIKKNGIFEYSLVIYYNPEKARIGRTMLRYTESGLWSRVFDCTDKAARDSCRLAKITLFDSLDQFVQEYSGFSDLVLDNFRYIFFYYALACSLAFVVFGVHHLPKFAKKIAVFLGAHLMSCFVGIKIWLEESTTYLSGLRFFK